MTKTDLVRTIAQERGLPTQHVAEIIDAALEGIIKGLEGGGSVRLRGFGQFSLKRRLPRKGRSLTTGEAIVIPAKQVTAFKPGTEMQRRLEEVLDEDWVAALAPQTVKSKPKVATPDEKAKALRDILINIREIRDHTTFLWRKILGVKGDRGSFTCQIRKSTFFQVEDNMTWLQGKGFFKFSVGPGFDQNDDNVMQLRVYEISEQFNEYVGQIVSQK
ncbi:MAG: integration host factor subunit beta [Nitrospirae bacterium]|nr:integration host factor subunit beta [Magnetococcales bacterium]